MYNCYWPNADIEVEKFNDFSRMAAYGRKQTLAMIHGKLTIE